MLAEYHPGATIVRSEKDSRRVYEAHLTTAAGEQLAVEVDKAFTVMGKESNGGHGGSGPSGSSDDSSTDEGGPDQRNDLSRAAEGDRVSFDPVARR